MNCKSAFAKAARLPLRSPGKLRAILNESRLTPEKLDELLSAINTRCAEVEDLRLLIDRTTGTDVMKRVAHQVEDPWREMAKLVTTRASTWRAGAAHPSIGCAGRYSNTKPRRHNDLVIVKAS